VSAVLVLYITSMTWAYAVAIDWSHETSNAVVTTGVMIAIVAGVLLFAAALVSGTDDEQ